MDGANGTRAYIVIYDNDTRIRDWTMSSQIKISSCQSKYSLALAAEDNGEGTYRSDPTDWFIAIKLETEFAFNVIQS